MEIKHDNQNMIRHCNDPYPILPYFHWDRGKNNLSLYLVHILVIEFFIPIVYYEVWKYGNVLLFNLMNMYKNYSLCLEYLNSHWFNNYNSIHIINVTSFYHGKYIDSIEVSMIFDEFNKPCKILPGMTINNDVNYNNKWNNQYLATLSFLIDHNWSF